MEITLSEDYFLTLILELEAPCRLTVDAENI